MHEGNFVDVELEGGKDSLVYLTADSENVIEELESGKTYVLGGIVDKNRYKKLCYNIAHEAGIQTARLPLGEYLEMQTRKVLTINHGTYGQKFAELAIGCLTFSRQCLK